MSKNGSKKEFIFNLILQRNPQILKPFLGEVELLELEYDSVKRIDVYGHDLEHNSPIYIESQLGCSDEVHFDKVKYLIETNKNESGIFIWIASRFKEEYLVAIEQLLELHAKGKPIKILALTFQNGYTKTLNKLNRQKDSDIWYHFNHREFVLPKLSIVKQWGGIPLGFKDSVISAPDFPLYSTSSEAMNSYLLSTLRKEIPYLLNVHRSKKLTVNSIVFGSGYSDFSFVINLAACEIAIRLENEWQSQLFQRVVSQFKDVENFETIFFEGKRIVFPILDLDNPREKVEMATKLFRKVVDVTIPTIYNL
ncbi:hypothetical protein [Heyndrickxia sp. FSL W8-0423]|uniref:hypothetical protein n=1 Tax=Heyndrickxia sp. FSL W8-0423 TaxID=2921601 RepID=UPI0030F82F64